MNIMTNVFYLELVVCSLCIVCLFLLIFNPKTFKQIMIFILKVGSSKPLFLVNIFSVRIYFRIKTFLWPISLIFTHYRLIYIRLTFVQSIVEKRRKFCA